MAHPNETTTAVPPSWDSDLPLFTVNSDSVGNAVSDCDVGSVYQTRLTSCFPPMTTLQDLLDNPSSMKRLVIKEIEGDAKTYGDARRTIIEEAERATFEQKVIDEPVTVIISQKGWVRARTGHGHDATQFTFKAGDSLYGAFECRTVDNLLAFKHHTNEPGSGSNLLRRSRTGPWRSSWSRALEPGPPGGG